MSVAENFDALTDTEFGMDVGTIFAAFLAPTVASGAVDRLAPTYNQRIPRELYGAAEIVAAEWGLDGDMKVNVQTGGGLYVADKLAERLGIKGRIAEAMSA